MPDWAHMKIPPVTKNMVTESYFHPAKHPPLRSIFNSGYSMQKVTTKEQAAQLDSKTNFADTLDPVFLFWATV